MTGGKRSNLSDRERVEVMLSVLPWLAASGGAPLGVAAEKFGVDPQQLRDDLMTVFYDVEPEIGADSMVEVFIDDDEDEFVTVRLPGSFDEPPDLDHTEALALLAAASALVGQPGTDLALLPAVDKLHAALGVDGASAVQVDLGAGDPGIRSLLAEAVESGHVVEFRYFSWNSDEVANRRVDPWLIRSVGGHWYLTGWCHDREAPRHFRLDRILAAEVTGSTRSTEVPPEPPEPMQAHDAVPTIVVELPVGESWLVDSLPTRHIEEDDRTVRVTLEVRSEGWLDRLLVSLGDSARVYDSDGTDLAERRAALARRILRNTYRREGGAPDDR
ncbi:MAG: WYL domain-containing protein [Microthrixaceae bacterium]|nr:WYL domain-containing protein [Microthrixaceae bacterium]